VIAEEVTARETLKIRGTKMILGDLPGLGSGEVVGCHYYFCMWQGAVLCFKCYE